MRRVRLQHHLLGLLVGIFLTLHLSATAAEPPPPAGTSLYDFGLHLFARGDFYGAITEFKRFSLLFPQHPQYVEAQVLLGLAFQEEEDYATATAHFQRLHTVYRSTDVDRLSVFKLGEIHLAQRLYPMATRHFQRFLHLFPQGPLVDRTTYLLGLSLSLDGHAAQAQNVLQTLPRDNVWRDQADALQEALAAASPPETKSPRRAGTLAGMMPGAGHLYIGKPVQAVTAFLLNGLFITGAIYAFLEGLEATGAILLYFETGWYLGNINSAVEGARAFNEAHTQAIQERLYTTFTPPHLTLHDLPGLGLRLNF
jgi:outer membrane protein assembly factor BamD (BamD/ComL family)